ncbi:glycerol-3-phosphate acyltransferase [Rubellimicrobium thermophilum DSM 16684]|uniref:Glycerol-3-phosphate acyltransferase n=1 Tax=Rubellimicrobium thermophilum DSM 16684 TaxID=1123069 RepID=S9SAG6_9RHOB|nr:1-acyl-sn-glycerol-3-phosphate acyltransferase [Rubellimicrobium thermophilum]EPX83249.1 glycerol-3-phosphate acyltransferase [Rubellimicrobium thermophilum DSM 16684]
MTRTVELPLWLLVLILLFAGVTFASHFLVPSVRWFFRRRMERVVARLNTRLSRPIAPFKLARRHDMIERLVYDPEVVKAVAEDAHARGIPESVAWEEARRHAREIVPAFSATLYFGWGARLARWISRGLYRVRLSENDLAAIDALPQDASVVFVMNHRSNMDYVLVTWLVSERAALSYAVGEWARVWPLSSLIRMMGAYFIRRQNRSALYRRVLARYVQMATDGGVTQAIFPEGRLSLDGRMGPPRLGLLSYIAEDGLARRRDVIFVPVALNYDRVIEDRFLIRAHVTGIRRFRPTPGEVLKGLAAHLWDWLRGRFRGFGTVRASFGPPLSLKAFLAEGPERPAEALGAELMARIACAMPALPVPLVARALLLERDRPLSRERVEARVRADIAWLAARGGVVPRRGVGLVVGEALSLLAARGILTEDADGRIRLRDGEETLLAYYAGSIAHLFGEEPQTGAQGAAIRAGRPGDPHFTSW